MVKRIMAAAAVAVVACTFGLNPAAEAGAAPSSATLQSEELIHGYVVSYYGAATYVPNAVDSVIAGACQFYAHTIVIAGPDPIITPTCWVEDTVSGQRYDFKAHQGGSHQATRADVRVVAPATSLRLCIQATIDYPVVATGPTRCALLK